MDYCISQDQSSQPAQEIYSESGRAQHGQVAFLNSSSVESLLYFLVEPFLSLELIPTGQQSLGFWGQDAKFLLVGHKG